MIVSGVGKDGMMGDEPRKGKFSVEKAESGLAQCLQLNLYRPRQGATLDRFDLSLDLNCGFHPLAGGLSIAAKSCRVFMVLDGCAFQRGTPYKYSLQSAHFERSETRDTQREKDYGASAEVKAEGGVKDWLPSFGASAKAQAQAGGQVKSTVSEASKITPAVSLISFDAGNTWRIGDDRDGDVRHPDGFLRGEYFNEDKDEDGSAKPACWLTADDGAQQVKVTVGVAIRPGDLWVREAGTAAKATRADDRGDGMAERLAGMAVLKKLKARDRREMTAALPDEHALIAVGAVMGVVDTE